MRYENWLSYNSFNMNFYNDFTKRLGVKSLLWMNTCFRKMLTKDLGDCCRERRTTVPIEFMIGEVSTGTNMLQHTTACWFTCHVWYHLRISLALQVTKVVKFCISWYVLLCITLNIFFLEWVECTCWVSKQWVP